MLDLASNMWIYRYIGYLFSFYEFCLFAYIISSWFPNFRNNIVVEFLQTICEPYLKVFRKIIPPIGVMDISPILALICLQLLQRLVISLVFGIPFF